MAEATGVEGLNELPAPPAKKRSLFSKTISQLSEADKAVDFFSRAKEVFPERLAEEQRKREKKIAKLGRKRSSASAEKAPSTPERKRRRISAQAEDSSDSSTNHDKHEDAAWNRKASTHSTPGSQKSRSSNPILHTSPATLSGRYSRDLKAEKQKTPKKEMASKVYISLSDSDGEGGANTRKSKSTLVKPIFLEEYDDLPSPKRPRPPPEDDDLQISDEEFPELVAQARERERKKALERLNANKSFEAQNHGAQGDDIFQEGSSLSSDADPTIELLITSEMEGTNPLKVRRKLSQRLKEVRLNWCDKQGPHAITPAVKETVFFTWKRIRLYDLTTCRSLGFSNANLRRDGEGFDPDGRVHLEAWTEALFNEHERKRIARERQGEDGGIDEPKDEDKAPKIKLILKARDLEPLKIVVKPTTLVARLISAFRQKHEIPETMEVILRFDGDKLEPESQMEETELGNMDTVEVHVR